MQPVLVCIPLQTDDARRSLAAIVVASVTESPNSESHQHLWNQHLAVQLPMTLEATSNCSTRGYIRGKTKQNILKVIILIYHFLKKAFELFLRALYNVKSCPVQQGSADLAGGNNRHSVHSKVSFSEMIYCA